MMSWFRRTLGRGFVGLVVLTVAVSAFDYLYAPTPVVRARLPFILEGAAAGVLIAVLTLALEVAITLIAPESKDAGRERRERFAPHGVPATAGAFCFSAVAEEVLFRGYLLNAFLSKGILFAWCIHAAAVLAAYTLGRRHLPWTLVRFLQANFLAYAFLRTRSLATCVTAHLVMDVIETAALPWLLSAVGRLRKRPGRFGRTAAVLK